MRHGLFALTSVFRIHKIVVYIKTRARILAPMQAYLDTAIEVKSFNDETGEFEGYASTYGNVDSGNDMVCKGAFDDVLASGQLPAMCLQHKMDNVIGEWLQMKSDARGLLVKGRIWINKGIGDAERAWLMLKSKGPKGLSIGFIAKAAQKATNGVRMITKAALKEISVVTYPMNELAQVISMKSDSWNELLEGKYSPDQERDDHGRFGGGSGGSTDHGKQAWSASKEATGHAIAAANLPFDPANVSGASLHSQIGRTPESLHGLSSVAHGASSVAAHSNAPQDHAVAANAHQSAFQAHSAAATATSGKQRELHTAASHAHLAAATNHFIASSKKSDDPNLETKAALEELTSKINSELVKSALRRNINNLTATSST